MLNFKQKLLIYFTALSAGVLLISNLSAVKLWNFFGIAVDGGILVFPLSYILNDLIVEFYGKHVAKHIIWSSFAVNILALLVFNLAIALPVYPGWEMQSSFASVLGFTPRIILASLTAYVCSNYLNNYIFTRLKNTNSIFATSFITRALGSSTFAHLVDTFLFETIAFFGVLTFHEFVIQACFAYVLGLGFEIILSPIELMIQRRLKGRIDYDNL